MKTAFKMLIVTALAVGSLQAANLTKDEALKIVTPFYSFMNGKAIAKEIKGNFAPEWNSYFGNGEKDFRNFE